MIKNTKLMNKQPLIFERIIRGDLRPWLEVNRHEEKFDSEIGDLIIIEPHFVPLYEIAFYPHLNAKTRYFHKLIINEANNYCNHVIELINSDDDIRIIKYLSGDTLKKKLRTFLKDTAKLIKARDLDLKYINPYKSSFATDMDHKSDTYIIQLLKTALLKVYLEIQEAFKSFISSDDYMGIEELYLQYLFEPIPEQTFLKRQTILEIASFDVKHGELKVDNVSRITPKSFKYNKLATNPDALIDLSNSLKLNQFIDQKSSTNDFKRVFSGKEIKNPVRWTGNISEFYWFIYLIYTKYKLVEDLKQKQWKVACRCFVKADWTPFERSKLKNLKRPQLTGELIEKAVELLR
jgi:hypothetical protein